MPPEHLISVIAPERCESEEEEKWVRMVGKANEDVRYFYERMRYRGASIGGGRGMWLIWSTLLELARMVES